jgi:hypothetical protein
MDTGPAPNVTNTGFSVGSQHSIWFYNGFMYVIEPKDSMDSYGNFSGAIYRCDLSGNKLNTVYLLQPYILWKGMVLNNIAYIYGINENTIYTFDLSDPDATLIPFYVNTDIQITEAVVTDTYTYIRQVDMMNVMNPNRNKLLQIRNSDKIIIKTQPVDIYNYLRAANNFIYYESEDHKLIKLDSNFNKTIICDPGMDVYVDNLLITNDKAYIAGRKYDQDYNTIATIVEVSLSNNSISTFYSTLNPVLFKAFGSNNLIIYAIDFLSGNIYTSLTKVKSPSKNLTFSNTRSSQNPSSPSLTSSPLTISLFVSRKIASPPMFLLNKLLLANTISSKLTTSSLKPTKSPKQSKSHTTVNSSTMFSWNNTGA